MKGLQSWVIQPPSFPSFLRAPSSCDMHSMGGGSLRTGAEEKLGKSVSPHSHHVCLEKARVLREKPQYQANPEHDGGTLHMAVT
ncbi:hypothetical protein Nmel_009083 [Mimus melanotis]